MKHPRITTRHLIPSHASHHPLNLIRLLLINSTVKTLSGENHGILRVRLHFRRASNDANGAAITNSPIDTEDDTM